MTTSPLRNSIPGSLQQCGLLLVSLLLTCFTLPQRTQAVVPPPDGGYPGFNTAEGQNALLDLTTGSANTAVGWHSLSNNSEGSFNTATGAGALLFNTADENTAFGAVALFNNATGEQNTAVGATALLNNTTGSYNTANGHSALRNNTTGSLNTANGFQALFSNTEGDYNTANGFQALFSNTEGVRNTANGDRALYSNTGDVNTANGDRALFSNTTGTGNTANGVNALFSNRTGADNTALGAGAGSDITGSGNVCIGEGVRGMAGVNDTTWIGNVYSSVASGRAVYVNSDNKIGTLASTRRVKNDIKPMDKASEAVLALKPVSFRYKKEIDASGTLQFGLVAEEVADINADLVARDSEGKPETVRYEAVNAMLLNEFLKEHRRNEEQEATIARLIATDTRQQTQIEALTAALQKVSVQLEVSRPAPQTVLNNQ